MRWKDPIRGRAYAGCDHTDSNHRMRGVISREGVTRNDARVQSPSNLGGKPEQQIQSQMGQVPNWCHEVDHRQRQQPQSQQHTNTIGLLHPSVILQKPRFDDQKDDKCPLEICTVQPITFAHRTSLIIGRAMEHNLVCRQPSPSSDIKTRATSNKTRAVGRNMLKNLHMEVLLGRTSLCLCIKTICSANSTVMQSCNELFNGQQNGPKLFLP